MRSLVGLGEGLAAGLVREVMLAGDGSVPETRAVAGEAGVDWVAGAVKAALLRASGDWVLVLAAGQVVAAGWAEVVLRHLSDTPPQVARLRLDSSGLRLLGGRILGAQAVLVPRDLVVRLGPEGQWRGRAVSLRWR